MDYSRGDDRCVDLLVIPPRWYENIPPVLLNELATQTSVLVSDVEGVTEFGENGVPAVSFQRGSVDDLEAKLRLLKNIAPLENLSNTTRYERAPHRSVAAWLPASAVVATWFVLKPFYRARYGVGRRAITDELDRTIPAERFANCLAKRRTSFSQRGHVPTSRALAAARFPTESRVAAVGRPTPRPERNPLAGSAHLLPVSTSASTPPF